MRVSIRFTAAVHTLLCIARFSDETKVTSDFIADSTGVNAVIIRKTLRQLQDAGLVRTVVGMGGSYLEKAPKNITLLDVYKAINPDESKSIFDFHPNPSKKCPVGKNIHKVLDPCLDAAEAAMEKELNKKKLSDLLNQLSK